MTSDSTLNLGAWLRADGAPGGNELHLPTNLERAGTRVDPLYGGRGGGREFMSLEQIEVEIINVQPYVR